ncbi:MAG: hypothetical protein JWP63_5654 [Candidatus Solibacter sp.]|nr:hypothetical protein [Candidatus Solibacter sp.]
MVNAASYGSAVAPDSLVTIFGSGLAQTTATAVLDANGQLPTELAATRVEIAGVAAQLFYVSASQINLVVPGGIDPGTVDVVVKSTAGGTSKTATALIAASAPGIFTTDASGRGAGAILNAVTFQRAPFVVQTAENGADTRTRLAIYGTGFRHGTNVTAMAQDPAGDRFNLTVEFAGAAPGFIGLDQVNVLLPPDLDGAGTVTLSLGVDGQAANQVTIQVNLMAASALQLATISITPTFLNAGDTALLTVGLNGVARSGGVMVMLRSTNPAAVVPAQLTISEGRASAQTSVTTLVVPAVVVATIQAQVGLVTQSTLLEIDPQNTVQLSRLTISPSSLLGGRNFTGTVLLSGTAPAAGAAVAVTSDNDAVRPPAIVTVPFGQSSMDFTIASLPVTTLQAATVTASYNRSTTTAKVTVLPPLQLTLDQSSIVAGLSVTATVTLGEQAPAAGAVITMQSSDGAVKVPLSVTVPAGQTAQTFTVTTTSPITTARIATLTATYGGAKQTVALTVTPQVAATLSKVTVSPNPVMGGNNAQGTVTLTSPATTPLVVTLFSASAFAFVPASVTVPQGQTEATFPITTSLVPVATSVTITASLPGVSRSTTLTVQ